MFLAIFLKALRNYATDILFRSKKLTYFASDWNFMINFEADTIIITEGSIENQMYIVIEGKVAIYIERDGKEIPLATIDAPNFLGEMAIYRNQHSKYSAKALTDTRMLVIENQAQIESFVTKNLSLSATMMTIMGNRIAIIDDLLITKMEEINKLNVVDPFLV